MTISLATLRAANVARQAEWPNAKHLTPLFRAVELGGEAGETMEAALKAMTTIITLGVKTGHALNVAKKLEREALGVPGSRATLDDLADELADVLQCIDLVAMEFDIDLGEAVVRKFNEISDKGNLKLKTHLQHEPTLDAFTLKDLLRRAYHAGAAAGSVFNADRDITRIVDQKVKEELNGHTS